MTDKYAVIGNPISHSKSPLIHAAFAKQTKQDISYESTLAPLDGFADTVKDLITQGYKGVNVTVPFKFEAFNCCDYLSERALAAGAVNTLFFKDDKINGDNTDGAGLISDIKLNLGHALQPQGLSPQNIPAEAGYSCLKGARVLLLGAGGAAQGVLLPLLTAQPESITVANRSLEKAHFMVQKLAAEHTVCNMAVSNFENIQGQFDIIINATSTGLTNAALPIANTVFAKNCLAYDMMYGRETPFMAQARINGAQVADGLGMLVEQAAEAFYLWRGVRPETKPVIEMMRLL